MTKSFTGRKRIRKSFGRIPEVAPMPNLIEVQKSSYDHFLQMGVLPEHRTGVGLQEVFKSVFPIRDFADRVRLERAAEGKSLQPYEAQGMAKEEILAYFFDHTVFHHGKKGWTAPFNPER